jgi:HD superfamily phosphohydrolase YqeK
MRDRILTWLAENVSHHRLQHILGVEQTSLMSKLSCVIFIADALEPNRGDNEELSAMRKVATENLYKCVQQTSDYSLEYLVSNQKIIHPRTILTRNWALAKARQLANKSQ